MIGVDWEKNDIFSLGLTFLEALTLKSAENLLIETIEGVRILWFAFCGD